MEELFSLHRLISILPLKYLPKPTLTTRPTTHTVNKPAQCYKQPWPKLWASQKPESLSIQKCTEASCFSFFIYSEQIKKCHGKHSWSLCYKRNSRRPSMLGWKYFRPTMRRNCKTFAWFWVCIGIWMLHTQIVDGVIKSQKSLIQFASQYVTLEFGQNLYYFLQGITFLFCRKFVY